MNTKNDAVYQIIKLLADAPESQVAPTALQMFNVWINNPPTAEQIVEVRNYLSYNGLSSDFVISALSALESIVRSSAKE